MGQNESTEVEAGIQAQFARFSSLQISKRQSSFEFLPDAIMIVLLKIHQIQNNVHDNNLYAQRVISLSNMKHYTKVWKIYHPEWMKEVIDLKYSECLVRYNEKLTSLLQEVRNYSQELSQSSWIIEGAIAEKKIERPDQETIDMTRIELSREVADLQVIILEWLQKLSLDKQSKRIYSNLLDKAKKHMDDIIGQPDVKPEDQRKGFFSDPSFGLKTLPKKIKDKFDTIRHKKKPEPVPPDTKATFMSSVTPPPSPSRVPSGGRTSPKIVGPITLPPRPPSPRTSPMISPRISPRATPKVGPKTPPPATQTTLMWPKASVSPFMVEKSRTSPKFGLIEVKIINFDQKFL